MIRAQVHFPTYHPNTRPLRTQFTADATRPSIVLIYQRVNGRMKLVRAELPKEAIK